MGDSVVGETITILSSSETSSSISKTYKESIPLKIIISIVCALLNSIGGNLVLYLPSSQMSKLIRKLEQSMISIIGAHQTTSNINVKEDKESIVITVKKSAVLITTNYNLYLPTETQVVLISSWESQEIIMDHIIKRKVVPQPVPNGSHCKIFLLGKKCVEKECKSVEFQFLRSDRAKRTRLADRMTSKGNKFSCYVSAFANYHGGHIYYGIRDDGIVEGELISSEDMREITKKVEKTINKMIWPELFGQPRRGVQWDIFFEPVVGEDSMPVPSTFVIVVYIAACLGGVFTEEPECYEIVLGKVQKMSFVTWKRRISQPVWLRSKDAEIPSSVRRTSWSSADARKAFTVADQVLMQFINNGSWYAISQEGKHLQKRYENHSFEMKLLVLSKQVTACYRRGNFNEAQHLLQQYAEILPQAEDSLIFQVMKLYLDAALKRASGESHKVKDLLVEALSMAELIEPGLVTAIVYTFSATVADLFIDSQFPTPDVLSIKALEHLSRVPDSSDILADMKQKSFITLATFHLRCNIRGKCAEGVVDIPSLNTAKTCITTVHQSICEGNPLSGYREVQFNLVQSIYLLRRSQTMSEIPNERTRFLRNAFNYAKKAECLSKDYQFNEMLQWSKANQALCTEELVRTAEISHSIRKSNTLPDSISCTAIRAIQQEEKSITPLQSKSRIVEISDSTNKSVAPIESKSRTVEISDSINKSIAPFESKSRTAEKSDSTNKSIVPLESKSRAAEIIHLTRNSIAPCSGESKSRTADNSHSTRKSIILLESKSCTAGTSDSTKKSTDLLESKSRNTEISHFTRKSIAPEESKLRNAEISDLTKKPIAMLESKSRTAETSDSTKKTFAMLESCTAEISDSTKKPIAMLELKLCTAEISDSAKKSVVPLEPKSRTAEISDSNRTSIAPQVSKSCTGGSPQKAIVLLASTSSLPESAPCLDI